MRRLRIEQPAIDPCLPITQTSSPLLVPHHDTTITKWITNVSQSVIELVAEGDKKRINLRLPGVGKILKDKAVVLIRMQQHLLAAGTAHNQEAVTDIRRRHPCCGHLCETDLKGATDKGVMDVRQNLHDFGGAACLRKQRARDTHHLLVNGSKPLDSRLFLDIT